MSERVAFFEASAGCAGDMFLGALVAAGLPIEVLQQVAKGLAVEGLSVQARSVMRGALSATKVDVVLGERVIQGDGDRHVVLTSGLHTHASGDTQPGHAHDPHHHHHHHHEHDHAPAHEHEHPHEQDPATAHSHGHTTLQEVRERLARLGSCEKGPLRQALAVFEVLAQAEAQVHGVGIEEVHFHEVGAADALVDIAGTCIGLAELGVTRVYVSPLPWGRGVLHAAHGHMPNPAPATVRLLEGLEVVPSRESYEQVTPTGAALVRVLSNGCAVPTGFMPGRSGFGAGARDQGALPNALGLTIGTLVGGAAELETVVVLETNLDDATGQVVAVTIERALGAGALDAWWTPCVMKKGRPGGVLSLLCAPGDVETLEALVFRETPTLGVRRHALARRALARRVEVVKTPYGPIRMKVRSAPDGPQAQAEYEDCRAAALSAGVSVRMVMEAAQRAWSPT